MLKLRHLCLEHCEAPEPIKSHMHWEIQHDIKKLIEKKMNLENSLDHLRVLRNKHHSVLEKRIIKRIFKAEDEIATMLFDQWEHCEDEREEIWREYFFCLYDFMITDKIEIDMSNIVDVEHSVLIYERLKRPTLYQSSQVRLMDYKFLELYTIYKNIEKPNTFMLANEILDKKIEITKEICKLKTKIQRLEELIGRLDRLLS